MNQVSPSSASTGPSNKGQKPSSFELQLEAARRASDIRKMFLGEYPTKMIELYCLVPNFLKHIKNITLILPELSPVKKFLPWLLLK